MEAVKSFWDEHGEKVKMVLGVIGNLIKTSISVWVNLFEWAVETVSWLIDFVTAIFKGDWDSAFKAVDGLLQTFSNKNVLDTVLWFFGTSLDEIYETVSNVFNSIAEAIGGAFEKAYKWIKSTFFDPVIDKINYIKSLWQSVMDFFWWSSESVGQSLTKAEHRVSSILASRTEWARAEGWPVSAWSTYLVWEKWPELFVPKTSGEIVPNEDLNKGGGDINITISGTQVNNQSDIDSLVDTLIRRIKLERNFWIA